MTTHDLEVLLKGLPTQSPFQQIVDSFPKWCCETYPSFLSLVQTPLRNLAVLRNQNHMVIECLELEMLGIPPNGGDCKGMSRKFAKHAGFGIIGNLPRNM